MLHWPIHQPGSMIWIFWIIHEPKDHVACQNYQVVSNSFQFHFFYPFWPRISMKSLLRYKFLIFLSHIHCIEIISSWMHTQQQGIYPKRYSVDCITYLSIFTYRRPTPFSLEKKTLSHNNCTCDWMNFDQQKCNLYTEKSIHVVILMDLLVSYVCARVFVWCFIYYLKHIVFGF